MNPFSPLLALLPILPFNPQRRPRPHRLLVALAVVACGAARAGNVALDLNQLPSAQGWSYTGFSAPCALAETQVFSAGGSSLHQDSTGCTGGAAYALDGAMAVAPYTLTVTARVTGEQTYFGGPVSHFGLGFGALLNGEETFIGLGPGAIVGLDGSANGVVISTAIDTSVFHTYQLAVTPGAGYTLAVDGMPIYSGSAFAVGGGLDRIFFGDASSRADAVGDFSRVEAEFQSPVPEPSSLALCAAGLALLGWRRRRGLPLLLCGLLAGGAAQAASDHFVHAFVDARGNGQTQQQDTGSIDGPVASAGPLGFSVVDAFGSYDSSISGNAAYGHLWGQASAAQNSPQFPRQSDANADSVNFQDRLTLSSASLAPGTVVLFSATMVLTDKLSAGSTTCCANVAVNGRWDFAGVAAGDQAGPGQSIDHQVTQVFNLQWAIGAPHDIGAILFYDVGSSPGVNASTGNSRVDLADVVFTLSLAGDVVAQAASGHDYTAPVPEPASALLLLLGVAALPALRRRALHSRA